jgi:PTS system mannose-specific IIC component
MDLLWVALLGGWLGLDATGAGQFMVSRPIVAGLLTGLLVGDPVLGMSIGALLEMFLLVSFPTGGSGFPESATASVVAVTVGATLEGPGALPLALALGLVWGRVGEWTVGFQRSLNGRLIPTEADLSDVVRRLERGHRLAVATDFGRAAIVTVVGVLLGRSVLGPVSPRWALEPTASQALLLAGAAVSLGVLLHDFGGFRRRKVWFAAGMAIGIIAVRVL